MQRRTFLLGSAMALRAFGANDKVNVAIVGIGGRGKAHIREYMKLDSANVAALCDVDTAQTERGSKILEDAGRPRPKVYQDLRKLYEDKGVDAVSIATPNHWHALATIWACQAGKDVYCEKPAAYNMWEGAQMVAASQKYSRIIQIGMQSRSIENKMEAVKLLHDGVLGKLYLAKGLCYKRRPSIGHTPEEAPPPGLNWDIFLGPAPFHAYTKNRFAYNWHWFWDTGNGDIGNQGIHEMDVARWGMGLGLPTRVVSTGGKYIYNDDQETPNTQIASLLYPDEGAEIVFEVRGLSSNGEATLRTDGPNVIGDIFYGEKGYMALDHSGYQVFFGDKREPGPAAKAGREETAPHMQNFIDAVKSRSRAGLHADVIEGVTSVNLVHMANISYRLKRELEFDPKAMKFTDREATAMMARAKQREPYAVPQLA